jgi:hypothetical protein
MKSGRLPSRQVAQKPQKLPRFLYFSLLTRERARTDRFAETASSATHSAVTDFWSIAQAIPRFRGVFGHLIISRDRPDPQSVDTTGCFGARYEGGIFQCPESDYLSPPD